MSDLSEQGLARLQREISNQWHGMTFGEADALISALRQARADLREARGLLERAASEVYSGLEVTYPNERRWERDAKAFLSRTATREGGE